MYKLFLAGSSEENDCVDQDQTILFPNSDLCLIKFSEDTTGVQSQKLIQKGTKYGPYATSEYNEECDSIHIKLLEDENHDSKLNILDEMGSWLQYIRQVKQNESSNSCIFRKDNKIWLEVTNDIEPGNEIKSKYSLEILNESNKMDVESARNGAIVKVEPSSPETQFDAEENEHAVDKIGSSSNLSTTHTMEEGALEATNGTSSSSPMISGEKIYLQLIKVKKSSLVFLSIFIKKEDFPGLSEQSEKVFVESNQAKYKTLIRYYFERALDRFQFVCTPCGIVFSSQRNLYAHQTFYCIHRTRSEDVKNEIDEDGNTEDRNGDSRKESKINEHNKRSREAIEDGSASSPDSIESKFKKSGQIYSCIYCSYTVDKKSSLNRHMRMHSSPPPVNKTIIDNQMLAAAMAERQLVLMRSYCAECDIQFTSHKNFAVHKQIYCNTRRVQPRSSHNTGHHSSRIKSPAAQTSSSISTIDSAIAPWNFLQKNTFSSSPLILVPCSYIPGRGLVPASNLMLQNGEEFMANVNQHDMSNANEAVSSRTNNLSPIKNSSHKRVESSPEALAIPSCSEEKSVPHLIDSASSDSEKSLKHSSSFKHKILARNGIVSKEYYNLSRCTESRSSDDSQSVVG
ncbi:Zinc finger protein ush [Nymphon striatum]|nr:Zinc finger protein ush [Nymphon striatum]